MSIKVNHITKQYGTQLALNRVSFTLKPGEIVGFLGPNGAGKSTMMKIITGYLAPNGGEVAVDGLDVRQEPMAVRRSIGYLPEHNPLYPEMYIREYLTFVGEIYKLKNLKQRVDEMITLTGLSREQHKKIGSLSKGYRQRVGLAQALIHDPKVLILDEPTTGLDPGQLVEIRNLIRTLSKDKTVLLSTHIMQEVEAVCDRIIIINAGNIVADGSNDTVKALKRKGAQVAFVEFANPVDKEELLSIPMVDEVLQVESGGYRLFGKGKDDIRPQIFRFAVENNHTMLTLKKEESSLEDVFLEMTRE